MIVGAGFGEETVFRGYLFERFGKLFGSGVWAKTSIVLLTAVWFGLGHYSVQGLAGAEQATIVGLVFGTIFAVTGRIWMLMFAHAAFDLTAVAMIYWNLESAVAHLVFKYAEQSRRFVPGRTSTGLCPTSRRTSCQERADGLTLLNVEPMFDALRGDRRFRSLVRRIGLIGSRSA
ncbi:MAG: hypothetical protein DMG32_24640 [Acidobacteria bacterium]|nr:MAG: hypothetical protein DMG32_24640 [Acidobacteriota bacterium]